MNRPSVIAFVGLGANLSDALQNVRQAMTSIGQLQHTQVLRCSSLYRSAPIQSSGDDYINAALKISTALTAYSLLRLLQKLEQNAGRERPYINAPRTLDLDLLLYGSSQIHSEWLTVPHPRMRERAFVLLPLQEIAPELVSAEDLSAMADQRIEKIHQP
jgi:2-amino-4-hydroxy-6-hydroxymethyldihydropteridine diphosphokinase